MSTWVVVLLFCLGILLIVKGGDIFVDAASWIAEASGIPKFIIGATVVSLATTLPELLVSVIAAAEGKSSMAVGNAVGSVTANIGLIMGISLACLPSIIKRSQLALKASLMVGAVALLIVLSSKGRLSFLPSILLLIILAVFIVENVLSAKRSMAVEKENRIKPTGKEIGKNILKFVLGAAGIVVGADLLVDNGSALAAIIGVSESIIGVTVIAIGTSLPELVTTITALVKKEASLSVGNIIGANIIDLTMILPVCSLISGGSLPIDAQSTTLDLPACLLVSLIALVPPLICQKFRRWQGAALLAVYVVYIAVLCTTMI